jgi:mannose-6-phosphate isomerase-like protein (cupin superfamily)
VRKVKRTWGHYRNLFTRRTYKVKLLKFDPKKDTISYQRHFLRNELWLFIKGDGCFTLNKWDRIIKAGYHILVPKESWHSYVPFSTTYVVEIQFGEACEEEDIERERLLHRQ